MGSRHAAPGLRSPGLINRLAHFQKVESGFPSENVTHEKCWGFCSAGTETMYVYGQVRVRLRIMKSS